ncbi:PEPxxWA-CTERM sorting domain-containing protein [Methyloversatilis discipulorum]|uniref:PEPxxWA-CTERM sorting domain-containing protein n=1 Tax=Methyloversatilis discipulorum TaxID=1119528 RepID=UPI000368ADB8|nr:PEPxxWA-CTERM sorting domain-containing protein [Methyloversatilis discipulorum]
MNIRHTLAAALCAFALAPAAHAYTLDVVAANGNIVDTSFSTPDMLSIDFGLINTLPVTFTLTRDDSDLPMLPFNAIVRNYIGLGFESLTLTISGGLFNTLGSAGGTFGSVATVTGSHDSARITFSGPEYVEAALGDWFLDGSQTDFVLDIANATGPVTLTLAAAVPEPEGWAMMLAGMGLLGAAVRRRR